MSACLHCQEQYELWRLLNSGHLNYSAAFTPRPRFRRGFGQRWKQHSLPAETKWPSLAVTQLQKYGTLWKILKPKNLTEAWTAGEICLHWNKGFLAQSTWTTWETACNREKFFSFIIHLLIITILVLKNLRSQVQFPSPRRKHPWKAICQNKRSLPWLLDGTASNCWNNKLKKQWNTITQQKNNHELKMEDRN